MVISKRTSRSYVTHADTAPGYWMIGVLWRVLATGVQTGNAMCLLDQLCSKGSGPLGTPIRRTRVCTSPAGR